MGDSRKLSRQAFFPHLRTAHASMAQAMLSCFARRLFAKGHLPCSGGITLTAKLAILGDTAGDIAIAPCLQYAAEAWKAGLRDDRAFSASELSELWRNAGPANVARWAAFDGPVAACCLSRRRIGWTPVGPFGWADDRGAIIRLAATPPVLMRTLLRGGVLRSSCFCS